MDNDVLTRNENGELSVRTVSATEQANVVNPDDVYTRTTEGYLAVRTVGNGGSGGGAVDSVNGKTGVVVLTPSDIGAATAAQGAKADTAIQSVKTINGQSIVGEGNVDIDGLPAQTGQAGKVLTTDGINASWETPTTITMRTWGANE